MPCFLLLIWNEYNEEKCARHYYNEIERLGDVTNTVGLRVDYIRARL